MLRRFGVLPILAVVHKNEDTDETLGILMPYGGRSLESLAGGYKYGMGYSSIEEDAEDSEDEHADPDPPNINHTDGDATPVPKLPITEVHFQSLVMNLWELARVGVLHGDINDRNTLYTEDGKLIMIDLGGIAPDYKGDAHALGSMILWALGRVEWDTAVSERVRKISLCLQNIKNN
ncbi:unnamed protein product [Clonostachys rosea]|uniref:Protein kinase domain-containing protein n=1 Tax=Bionectria ochroleuca TaxID=29856 RepID=A0ABY6UJ12_BIOOC|nr:unnamed protein product [Clonostachys rosea]